MPNAVPDLRSRARNGTSRLIPRPGDPVFSRAHAFRSALASWVTPRVKAFQRNRARVLLTQLSARDRHLHDAYPADDGAPSVIGLYFQTRALLAFCSMRLSQRASAWSVIR